MANHPHPQNKVTINVVGHNGNIGELDVQIADVSVFDSIEWHTEQLEDGATTTFVFFDPQHNPANLFREGNKPFYWFTIFGKGHKLTRLDPDYDHSKSPVSVIVTFFSFEEGRPSLEEILRISRERLLRRLQPAQAGQEAGAAADDPPQI